MVEMQVKVRQPCRNCEGKGYIETGDVAQPGKPCSACGERGFLAEEWMRLQDLRDKLAERPLPADY
jgi:DnaJ-class molecular chaperone